MTSTAPALYVDYNAYLAVADDELAPVKHEYFEGIVYAMAGGTLAHSSATTLLTVALHKAFVPRDCRVYNADARVRIAEAEGAFYPDVTVVCGEVQSPEGDARSIANPTLLVETLSPGTRAYDLGKKFAAYRKCPTLQGVLFADPEARSLELYAKGDDGHWKLWEAGSDGMLTMAHWAFELTVDDIFGAA